MVISIGAIIAGAVSKMSAVQTSIQMRIDYRMSIFIGTPWIAFIIKVFYFDLSPHRGTVRSARAKKERAAVHPASATGVPRAALRREKARGCAETAGLGAELSLAAAAAAAACRHGRRAVLRHPCILSCRHQGDASVESHAMRVSKRRGVAWTLLHLPLFGAVRWVGAALQAIIEEESAQMYHGNLSDFTAQMRAACKNSLSGDGSLNCDAVADADAFNFCGSLVLYLLCATSVQVLHRGAGKRARRVGKKKRLMIRIGAILLLVGGTVTSVKLNWSIVTFFGWTTGLVTLLAVVELWGRGFSTEPDETVVAAAASEDSLGRLRAAVVPDALKRWMHHSLKRTRQAHQAAAERERSREERVSLHSPGHAGRSPVQPRQDDERPGTILGYGASSETLVEMPAPEGSEGRGAGVPSDLLKELSEPRL